MFPACKNNFLLCSLNQMTQLLFDFKMVAMNIAASLNDQSSTSSVVFGISLCEVYFIRCLQAKVDKSLYKKIRLQTYAICACSVCLLFVSFLLVHTIPRYPITQSPDTQSLIRDTPQCAKSILDYHASKIEHGLYACTVDNPLVKARGLSLRTGAQTMLYLSLVIQRREHSSLWKVFVS